MGNIRGVSFCTEIYEMDAYDVESTTATLSQGEGIYIRYEKSKGDAAVRGKPSRLETYLHSLSLSL